MNLSHSKSMASSSHKIAEEGILSHRKAIVLRMNTSDHSINSAAFWDTELRLHYSLIQTWRSILKTSKELDILEGGLVK